MYMYRKALIAAAVGLAASCAFAADSAQPAAPAGVEREAALDTSAYTAIPRVFFNNNGATSFLRFTNASGAAALFEVKVTGGETGTDYTGAKSYQLTVPNKGSVQKSLDDIRTGITAAGGPDISLKSGDSFLNLYVTSDKKGAGVGFQHVTFNGNTGFFENVSLCTFDPTQDYSGGTKRVINVHTSKLAGYPSKVEIHNPDASARAVRGTVYDAATGAALGSFTTTVPANATTVVDESAIEQQISLSPTASQLHINIEFDSGDSGAYTAIVAHKVTQSSTGAVFNLSQVCAINPVRAASGCPTSTGGGTTTNPSGDTKTAKAQDTATGCCPSTPTTPGNPSAASARALDGAVNPSGSTGGSTSCGGSNDTFAAVGDTLSQTFTVGQPSTIALATLLANDTKATGATLDSFTSFVDFGTTAPNGTAAQFNGTVQYTTPSGGIASSALGGITYTPARAGTVSFTYRLKSAAGEFSNYATVTLSVGNVGMTANVDTLTQTFQVGQSASINLASLTANDTNATGATIESVTPFIDATTGAANGSYTQLPTIISYVPDRAGTVTFTYRLTKQGTAPSNYAKVTLTVGDPNLPRAAADTLSQSFTAGAASAITFASLTANDTNAQGATLENVTAFVDAGTATANGTYQVSGTTGITYTPARAGTVTFTYRLKNGIGLSEPATVTLTVGAGPTAAPVATDKTISYVMSKDYNGVEILPTDVGGDVSTTFDQGATPFSSLTLSAGDVSKVTLAPLATKLIIDFGQVMPNSFTMSMDYRLKNSFGSSNLAKVTVNVTKAQ